jgi:hypothetical protein
MELKVWVEGIQRIICGVTENTTCQVSAIQNHGELTGPLIAFTRRTSSMPWLMPLVRQGGSPSLNVGGTMSGFWHQMNILSR